MTGVQTCALPISLERDRMIFILLLNYIRKGYDDFYPFIIFKARDGSCIKLWHDPWCEGLPLKNIFPKPYNIASNKDASVAELLLSSEANYHWNIRYT